VIPATKLISVFIALLPVLPASTQQSLPPVGHWRDFLPYKSAIKVTAGNNQVFCATPFSFFTVDITENSVSRFSRLSGLHETGISTLVYDEAGEKLFIAYNSSNIDILYHNDVYNIPDIKRSAVQADKSIIDVYPYLGDFYLSTGLGVVVINGSKYEVRDTWRIGNGGGYTRVNSFVSDNQFFYAATEEGLKKINLSGSNPSDFNNWQLVSGNNGLPAGECKKIMMVQDVPVAWMNDSLFVQSGGSWNFLYTAAAWNIGNVNASGNKIIICEKQNGAGRVVVINTGGTVTETILSGITDPAEGISYQGYYWIADRQQSLLRYSSGTADSYRPSSPDSVATGQLLAMDNLFYAAAGSVNTSWQPQQNRNGFYKYTEGEWKNYNQKWNPLLDTVTDVVCLAADRTDASVWAGSFGGGLIQIREDNSLTIFKQNSPLQPAINEPGNFKVAGLAFDHDHNLWISNYGSNQPLKVRKNDGSWKSFALPFSLVDNALSRMFIDDLGLKWMISPRGNGLICFDDNHTIEDNLDDRWRLYRTGVGTGNLPSSVVFCVAGDKNGFIWVGTDDGIGVIQCPGQVFTSQGCDAVWPIVQQGSFAGYLFKGEEIRSIAVDGADRKWVATANGVFLISPEGEKLIYQFNESNSLLLSNDVRDIVIDGKSGEVFFGTAKGICSFRGTATEGTATNSNVLVFPNPVPPGYSGTIAIRGLVENAVVKITGMDGRLVYQTRALGGQAVWNGRDYSGRRIATGIYLVLVSDESRSEKTAAKIVLIAK